MFHGMRWAALAAVLGCSPTLRSGLANAPALGKLPSSEDTVTDAVANDQDSCGRALDPGPLRYRTLACPRLVTPPAQASFEPRASRVVDAGGEQWLEHYYVGWPCPRRSPQSAGAQLIAWAPTDLRGSHCALP